MLNQGPSAKEVPPKSSKHSSTASFMGQLNICGFRKVVRIEQGSLVKPERDDTEFQHPCFLRGQEQPLVKRKVTSVSTLRSEDIKIPQDRVTKLLTDMQRMKGKQGSMDSKLLTVKQENEALWRKVAGLQQKHARQQKVVNQAHPVPHLAGAAELDPGGEEKDPSDAVRQLFHAQYSVGHIHGLGPYSAPAWPTAAAASVPQMLLPALDPSSLTSLNYPSSPLASPGRSIDD
ncbi:heat shock factor protein 1 [Pontoporia blainvillei]|uniref:Heat shock factor protein 1 n=1 Tax=Pontoporia blainvillei TaxID=48723 RepID=A0ABX0SB38_PONBL|nr:heat shock factor protein 1 [Pontoporia blainvillei]